MVQAESLTDLEMIAQVREGNRQAFQLIVEKYEQQIARTVIGMLGNCQEAEDVGQEVFIRFYRSLAKFKGEASLGTYLTRIAINLSLNSIKKQKRRNLFRSTDSEIYKLDIPDNELSSEQKDIQELVQKAILQLPKEFRSIVVLRMIEGYSTKEVAEILSIPMGTVLSRLSRAQKKLKIILEPVMK